MEHERSRRVGGSSRTAEESLPAQLLAVGKRTQVEAAYGPSSHLVPIQRAAAAPESSAGEERELPADGPGAPMPAAVQAKMSQAFGTDLSAVRIHEGGRAAALGAKAFTQGSSVHFAPGQYQPESPAGQELLGHELAHVVQQSQGRVQATLQAKGMDINDDAGLEAEADAMGAAAARGETVAAGGGTVTASSGRAPLQAVWASTSRFQDLWTIQWHRQEAGLQWFYNTQSGKYLFIVDGTPSSPAVHDHSYEEKTYAEWKQLKLTPPRQYREQDDRRLSPDERYGYSKQEPDFKAPDPQASPKDISDALDKGLGDNAKDVFEAIAGRVNDVAAAKVSLADKDLYKRIKPVFTQVKTSLNQRKLEPTPDVLSKVKGSLEPLKYKLNQVNGLSADTAAKTLKAASEALSELQYAALVLGGGGARGGFVLGAQGPVWNPDQVEVAGPEAKHGSLPPLDVLNLEVDGYYQSGDGVLHADEVKDTPRAMAEKVKKGGQLGRQVEWLKTPAINEKTGERYEKQVGYYVQAAGPGFDSILDDGVIDNLSLIEENQQAGKKFLLLHTERFSLAQLTSLMKQALTWLTQSKAALEQQNLKLGAAAKLYFGDLVTARKSLQDGPLEVE